MVALPEAGADNKPLALTVPAEEVQITFWLQPAAAQVTVAEN
jgi:hypothetical protein